MFIPEEKYVNDFACLITDWNSIKTSRYSK